MTRSKRIARAVYEWLDALVFALAAVMVLFCFVVKAYMVRGLSMMPTLADENRILVVSLFYQPAQGDVVILDESLAIGDSIVKRVVATEGQQVDIDQETGEVTVDGVVFDRPVGTSRQNIAGDMIFPATVPDGHVFVMGDNRENSLDSRYSVIGFIDRRSVIGKAVYVISPVSEARTVA